MKYIVAIMMMVLMSGCSTFELIGDLILIFDDEPKTGTIIMDDGTEYRVIEEVKR